MDTIDASTVSITVSVTNARAVQSKSLFALVDVEIEIAGVTFGIHGVQARRYPDGGTSVNLPPVRDLDGVATRHLFARRGARAVGRYCVGVLSRRRACRHKFEPLPRKTCA